MSTGGDSNVGSIYAEFEVRTEKARADLDAARKKMEETRNSLDMLTRVYSAGNVGTATFDQAHRDLTATLAREESQVRSLEAAIARQAAAMGASTPRSA
jgi:hypothetical protein